jgi:hypothetical protein
MIDFPDGTLRREHEIYREELERARLRYTDTRNPETRAAYLRALKMFADLVVYRKMPENYSHPDTDVRDWHGAREQPDARICSATPPHNSRCAYLN